MFSLIDISTSALVAQRTRLAAIANNIANVSTTRNEAGETQPYQARHTVFRVSDTATGPLGAAGVAVASVETSTEEPLWRYQPGHPDAIQEGPQAGYVAYPNINLMAEFTDALEATRSYEANVGVIEITRNLTEQTIRILA